MSAIRMAGIGLLMYVALYKPVLDLNDPMLWSFLANWPFALAFYVGHWLFWTLATLCFVGIFMTASENIDFRKYKIDLLRKRLGLPIKSEK
jgi:hypothetical protein